MAGFQAEGVVEALDYDFRTKANPDAPHGTIPEPTDDQIAEFLTGMKAAFKEVEKELPTGVDLNDTNSIMAAIDDLDPQVNIKITGKMCEVYAGLCSNTPTAKQIRELPPRIRQVFFAWLQGEVMAPEAVTGGGQQQVIQLRSGRAG